MQPKTTLGKWIVYGGMICGALIPIGTVIWAAYHYGVPTAREVFAPGSDDPPYANIERVEQAVGELPGMATMLETLIEQNEATIRRDRDREIRDLTESFLTNCRRLDDAMLNGQEPREYRAAIAAAQLRWMELHNGERYPLRPSCL